jgi:hypothetical protein
MKCKILFEYQLLFFMFLLISSCKIGKTERSMSNYNSKDISIISVIANPDNFHKKVIHVKGYFTMETEGQAIYFSKNDYEKAIYKNALFLYIPYEKIKEMGIELPYKGYVEIEGTFDKNSLGSYNFYSGGIKSITEISRLYKRNSQTDELDMD